MRVRFYLFVTLFLLLLTGFAQAQDFMGPGQISAPLVTQTLDSVGVVKVWNTQKEFYLEVVPGESWELRNVQVYVGNKDDKPIPATRKGKLIPGRFPYKVHYANSLENYKLVLSLEEDLNFAWGVPFASLRDMTIAVHVVAVKVNADGTSAGGGSAWAYTGVGVDTEVGEIDEATIDESEFEGVGKGWLFGYKLSHPKSGHFVDSPVQGLTVNSPTFSGETDAAGYFDYFPGETATFSIGDYFIGTTVADHTVSPLDFFAASDTEDSRVINMGRLLQSLDSDAQPKGGITITPEVVAAFETTMGKLELDSLNFSDDVQIDAVIDGTIVEADLLGVDLAEVSADAAKSHLDETLNNVMFRKNVSKTPELASTKAKMNISPVWFPALKANDEPAIFLDENGAETSGIPYYDENGELIRILEEAKPIIITYTDDEPDTGGTDTWAAISRDDGTTWKRKNLSRSGDLSSFQLKNGEEYWGSTKKPVFQVKSNKILVAWSSKYAKGGKPGYAEPKFMAVLDANGDEVTDGDGNVVYTETPNPSYVGEDIWGVGGPQRSVDYTEDFPEVGEIPYAALWICRGLILTEKELTVAPWNGVDDDSLAEHFVGEIVWFKPERVTSGRRDVNQIFLAAAGGAGFGLVWQEDPKGVQPGKAVGPGPGWGGATTSHKTDIWYSYLAWGDHSKVDVNFVPGSDQHDADVDWESNRPKALKPLSLPVRLSDNEVINQKNLRVELDANGLPVRDDDGNLVVIPKEDDGTGGDGGTDDSNGEADGEGTHLYAAEIPGVISGEWYEFTNFNDELTTVAITDDGRLLDGDTGASRGNIFLQPYTFTKPDGSFGTSAWAIITYEETKGAGAGPPETDNNGTPDGSGEGSGVDAYLPEQGKNVIYHSFDFKNPDLVAAGRIVNRPEFIDDGDNIIQPSELVYLEDEGGVKILDYLDHWQLSYENARRGRFMPQGIGAFGSSHTALVMVHKQGPDGAGRPSDILLRRWEYPADCTKVAKKKTDGTVVGYNIEDANGETVNPYGPDCIVGGWVEDTVSGQYYYEGGVQNMSSVTPTVVTDSKGDPDKEDAWGAVKIVEWVQTVDNLDDPTGARAYDNAGNLTTDLDVENPFDDARAHRGGLRGDYVYMGFSYSANWAAARNGHDHFDFYIRRSFDGGQTWITDPSGAGVEHCRTWTYPEGTTPPEGAELIGTDGGATKVKECTTYAAGQFEAMRNLSQLANHKSSVIEPRIVAVPGTIKAGGFWTSLDEDKQNKDVFYVAYGTSTNPKKEFVTDAVTGETEQVQEEPAPQDLFWSVSVDRGETYLEKTWVQGGEDLTDTTPEEDIRTGWDWMAKGEAEQGEVQLRMTPDGSRFYASWLDEGAEGSDIVFRRIMPPVFGANWAGGEVPTEDTTTPEP